MGVDGDFADSMGVSLGFDGDLMRLYGGVSWDLNHKNGDLDGNEPLVVKQFAIEHGRLVG